MKVLIEVIYIVLDIYKWVMLATIIGSWLIAFNVINTRNPVVEAIWRTLLSLTEPVLKPIRRLLPRMQIDLSPIIVFIAIYAVQAALMRYVYPYVF
ncbi:MAG: YggT family protein [Devosia sp.]